MILWLQAGGLAPGVVSAKPPGQGSEDTSNR